MDKNEQFILRLRKDSAPDKILRALLDKKLTEGQIVEIADGVKSWGYTMSWFTKFFDNVTMVKNSGAFRASYMDPMPSAPIPVGLDIKVNSVANKVAQDDDGIVAAAGLAPRTPDRSAIIWPQMPPMCQEMDNFREPTWYGTMKAAVERGRHISLQGPPSVGKDTAVIQLAAECGKPLVTIGGDAGFRRRDLVGQAQISNGTSFFEVADYAAAAINGWWVLLTEVNAADADALMYINTQLAAPYVVPVNGKAYPVHKDFRLFITYNAGLIGTKPLPQSFKDRFFPITVPFYNQGQLRRILEAHSLPGVDANPNHWSNVVVAFGVNMWSAYERGQMRYQITTRRLIDATMLMNDNLVSDIKEALTQAVLDAIDSAVERKAAEEVLKQTLSKFN